MLLSILTMVSAPLFSQSSTKNNYSGDWSTPASWQNNAFPGKDINGINVIVWGEIFSEVCLDFNRSDLIIKDTLVIYGNIELDNTSTLEIDSNGVLLVLGDYLSRNKVDVSNNGIVLVAGKFEMLSSDNQGSYINNGKTFLFDPDPIIKDSIGYESLKCQTIDSIRTCGYLTVHDYLRDPVSKYVQTLNYDITKISTNGNSCPEYSITVSNSQLCIYEPVVFSASFTDLDFPDSLYWDFGADATPLSAYGKGPHNVYYSNGGEKHTELGYLDHPYLNKDTVIKVHAAPAPINDIIGDKFNPNYPEYIESVCIGETSTLQAVGDQSLSYHWEIPEMRFDKTDSYQLSIKWDTEAGIYSVYVSAISALGCVGDSIKRTVNVITCPEENLFTEHTYAFSPNSDGYNDFWVIKNIEDYPLAKIRVFDKTGKQVYKSDGNYGNNWDGTYQGTVLPVDSYYFMINLSAYQKEAITGLVTLLYK